VSYKVLARKWRPQTFDEVVGQDHITRTLKKAVESARLSHAYLFSGPRGCGKTSTARILAKVINCANLVNGNPCNACDSCLGVIAGKNLDVLEIDGASHTGVNEVRDLQESIGYAPSQFANNVYIIDEVHMLSTHAFNALLKTLEEPPRHVYFIFATTAPQKIPDTIKSRCQRHHFKRLEVKEIIEQLAKICEAENVKSEEEALRLLARKAEGSMRDGQSLLDQCITASSGEVLTGAVREILGFLDQDMVMEFIKTIADRDSTAVLKQLDRAVDEGVDLEELLNALIEAFRDVMLLASSDDLSDLILRSKDEIHSLKGHLHRYELPDLVTIVEKLCNASPRLRTAGDPRILLESILVDLALLDRQTDIRELIGRLEGRGRRTAGDEYGGRPAKPAKRTGTTRSSPTSRLTDPDAMGQAKNEPSGGQTAPPGPSRTPLETPRLKAASIGDRPAPAEDEAVPEALDFESLHKLWNGFATVVRQKRVALGVCLLSGSLHGFDGHVITLRFVKGLTFHKSQIEDAANRKYLRGMMTKYFGRELELICVGDGDNKGAAAAIVRHAGPRKESNQRTLESRPIVKKILNEFDGEIIRYHP
jgi:DNA polymerase-3 subunit gamma/tau